MALTYELYCCLVCTVGTRGRDFTTGIPGDSHGPLDSHVWLRTTARLLVGPQYRKGNTRLKAFRTKTIVMGNM